MLNYFSHTSSLNLQLRGGIVVRASRTRAGRVPEHLAAQDTTSARPDRERSPSTANESFSAKRSGIVPRTVVEGSLTLNETHRH